MRAEQSLRLFHFLYIICIRASKEGNILHYDTVNFVNAHEIVISARNYVNGAVDEITCTQTCTQ